VIDIDQAFTGKAKAIALLVSVQDLQLFTDNFAHIAPSVLSFLGDRGKGNEFFLDA
jgi:hypothetical protein